MGNGGGFKNINCTLLTIHFRYNLLASRPYIDLHIINVALPPSFCTSTPPQPHLSPQPGGKCQAMPSPIHVPGRTIGSAGEATYY